MNLDRPFPHACRQVYGPGVREGVVLDAEYGELLGEELLRAHRGLLPGRAAAEHGHDAPAAQPLDAPLEGAGGASAVDDDVHAVDLEKCTLKKRIWRHNLRVLPFMLNVPGHPWRSWAAWPLPPQGSGPCSPCPWLEMERHLN